MVLWQGRVRAWDRELHWLSLTCSVTQDKWFNFELHLLPTKVNKKAICRVLWDDDWKCKRLLSLSINIYRSSNWDRLMMLVSSVTCINKKLTVDSWGPDWTQSGRTVVLVGVTTYTDLERKWKQNCEWYCGSCLFKEIQRICTTDILKRALLQHTSVNKELGGVFSGPGWTKINCSSRHVYWI